MSVRDTDLTALEPLPLHIVGRVAPGLALCAAIAAAALGLGWIENGLFGRAWLEPLVLAIVIGAGVRNLWAPGAVFTPGVSLSAKGLLEVAVVLLGASISASSLSHLGVSLVVGIVLLVVVGIVVGFAVGRALGLSPRMALLIACGNAICGNSAIAAVAPAIDADGDEVAASIAFTAALGVIVVLALPLLGAVLQMSALHYGALAGLTIYAVPQVLAASAPFGSAAIQTGTVVKLARVLMLGPVVVALSLIFGRRTDGARKISLHRLVPWFILGFIAMIALRSLNLIPQDVLPWLATASALLTVMAMAGLGLQTDLRAVARAGGRAVAAAVLSLVALLSMALILIRFVG